MNELNNYVRNNVMKISKIKLYSLLLIFCILFQNRFFHIMNASMSLTICLITSIVVLFVLALTDKFNNYCRYLYGYYTTLIIILIIPQSIYAFSQGETLDGYIDVVRGIISVLLAVPVLKIFLRKDGMKSVLDIIAILTTVTLSLLIINSFTLNNFGLQVFPFDYYQMPDIRRGNWIRIYLISDFTAFVAIYSFCRLLKKETRTVWYLLSFVICLGAEIYVEQSRMIYMAIIASCVITYTRILKRGRPVFYFIAVILVIIGMFGGWFDAFFSSFSINNDGLGISTKIRINEFQYAITLISEHPILGTGMVSDYLFDVVNNGFRFEFNHTDIGILGSVTYIGLVGTFVLFIRPYIRLIKTITRFPVIKQNSFEFCFGLGLIAYITITSMTVLVTDNARIFVWPFIIAVFEFMRIKTTNRVISNEI